MYATLGTAFNTQDDLFDVIIEAFVDEPVNLVLTVGHEQDPARFSADRPGVVVKRWIPQGQVLAHCDAVITHGGFGTVSAALAHRRPLVLLPISADQPMNAARVASLGAGRVLDADHRSAAAIREVTGTVLHDPQYRRAAADVANRSMDREDLAAALDRLERLAVERTPQSGLTRRDREHLGRAGERSEPANRFWAQFVADSGTTCTQIEAGKARTPTGISRLGFVDIRHPDDPQAAGALDLPGAPTSVAVHRCWALVAVVNEHRTGWRRPAQRVRRADGPAARHRRGLAPARPHDRARGQPDSVVVAPSGRYATIVIENERDEDDNDGLLPQPPAGRSRSVARRVRRLSSRGGPSTLTGYRRDRRPRPRAGLCRTSRQGEAVVSLQREWADDPAGLVKLGRYDVAAATWTFAHYPLDPVESPAGGVVGLSELTLLPDGRLAVIERDNQLGQDARIKRLTAVDPSSVKFAPFGATLPVLDKEPLDDVLGVLDAASISVPDKLEGMAVTSNDRVYIVTDNDGVDENYGETVFLGLGRLGRS